MPDTASGTVFGATKTAWTIDHQARRGRSPLTSPLEVAPANGDRSHPCHADATLPKDLIQCVDRLDKQSASAKTVMASNDQDCMRQWVDDLEQLGNRAEKACERATNI